MTFFTSIGGLKSTPKRAGLAKGSGLQRSAREPWCLSGREHALKDITIATIARTLEVIGDRLVDL